MYLLKCNNRNGRKRYEISSKLRYKHQDDFSDVVLMFLLLTFNFSSVSIVDFEQANVSRESNVN